MRPFNKPCWMLLARVSITAWKMIIPNGLTSWILLNLREEMATFVTLKIDGQLRGCIGNTHAISPLVTSINNNAWSAAYHDPRFNPLTDREFGAVKISISVLSPSTAISFRTEQELLQILCPGTDGLIIEKQGQRATFLPAVWETLPEKTQFLAHLKNKAGMKLSDIPERAWTYRCIHFQEQE